jgi:hypothetical protein
MELFIHRQNILFFQKLLAEQPPETRRLQILKLLAEEEAKSSVSRGDRPAMA